ncbi:MAG: response regulator [Verrucomicrobia bacterium]|nr:response regulator [Verrucomicrobiota bacterium]
MRRALKEAGITAPLHLASDGQEAINYLAGAGKYSERTLYPIPTYVFLDLKLPYKSGFEVFAWVREQGCLKDCVIIILTSSPEARDRERTKQLGANCYLVKPPGSDALREILCAHLEKPSS